MNYLQKITTVESIAYAKFKCITKLVHSLEGGRKGNKMM